MSTADKLSKLLETKEAIKQAIIDKGGTVGEVFADYPTAIQNIQGGGGSGTFVVPGGMRFGWSKFGEFPENWDWSEFEKETDLYNMFKYCTYLKKVPKLNITSATTSIQGMFNQCEAIKSIDISGWDTSRVTDMSVLFDSCKQLRSINFGEFDTSKNRNFQSTFDDCHNLETIPELNASSNSSTYSKTSTPICNCYALRNFGGLKGINKTWYITTAYSLSYESLINIINGLADGVSGQTLYMLQDQVNQLSDDDIAIATNKGWTISPSKTITEPVVVTNLSQIPSSTTSITQRTYDLSQYSGSWKSGSYTALPNKSNLYLFEGDVGNIIDASYMFNGCSNLQHLYFDLPESVTNTSYMFKGCTSLKTLPNILDTSNVTNMSYMFYYCKNIDVIPQLDTSNVTNMEGMFGYVNAESTPPLNTSNVENMKDMFYDSSFKSITMIGGVDKLTTTTSMFSLMTSNGTFYYDDRYDYSKIIAQLPSTWTAVPITV